MRPWVYKTTENGVVRRVDQGIPINNRDGLIVGGNDVSTAWPTLRLPAHFISTCPVIATSSQGTTSNKPRRVKNTAGEGWAEL